MTKGISPPEDERNIQNVLICYFIIEAKQKKNSTINVALDVFQTI